MEKLIICGNYGAGNVGDEAILRAMLQKFRKTGAKITVMGTDPEQTRQKFDVNTVALIPTGLRTLLKRWLTRAGRESYQKTIQAFRSADRFLLGGGTLLTDEPRQSMLIWGSQLEKALKNIPTVELYANGIGPFHSNWSKKWAKSFLKRVHKVSLRDNRSIAWAKSLGCQKVEKAKDPVQEWEWKKEVPSTAPRKAEILFVPRYWNKNSEKALDVFKQFVQYLVNEQGEKVIGISFDKNNAKDLEWLHAIDEVVNNKEKFEIRNDYKDEVEVVVEGHQ